VTIAGVKTLFKPYLYLCHSFAPSSISSLGFETNRLVERIWASWVPSMVVVFSWELLLGLLPTRVNFEKRRVIPSGKQACWHCGSACNETEDHLFLFCPFIWRVWVEVYKWFGLVEVLSGEVGAMFLSFFHALKPSKKVQKGVVMLWQVVVWVIWKTMNDTIFAQKTHDIHKVVEKIKRLT
jgi:hypothetical protein